MVWPRVLFVLESNLFEFNNSLLFWKPRVSDAILKIFDWHNVGFKSKDWCGLSTSDNSYWQPRSFEYDVFLVRFSFTENLVLLGSTCAWAVVVIGGRCSFGYRCFKFLAFLISTPDYFRWTKSCTRLNYAHFLTGWPLSDLWHSISRHRPRDSLVCFIHL